MIQFFSINDALNIFFEDWETKKDEKCSKEKESRNKLEKKEKEYI